MGLNFHKSVKVADGVKLNVGKKSAGVSVGGKYAGVSYNTKSGAKVRASLPGTGLSYTKSLNSVGKKKGSKTKSSAKNAMSTVLTVVIVAAAVVFLLHKNWGKISDTLGLGRQETFETTAPAAGNDAAAGTMAGADSGVTYVINTNTKKIHVSTCRYADTSSENITAAEKPLDELLADDYSKCKTCMK